MKAANYLASLLVCSLLAGAAYADDEPDANDIIRALKPGANTRGLRNLTVRPSTAPTEEAAPTPSPAPAPVHATVPAPTAVAIPSAPSAAPSASMKPPAAEAPSIALAINFELNSAKIRPDSARVLESLARALRSSELAGSAFLIEGHTDASGSPLHNRRLSLQRAEQVRRTLVAKGVEGRRLVVRGVGSDEPANPLDPYAAENRRVRIVNIDKN
jgi:outer membrane protein OmpA-like peptidoglycan-associated protein